MIKWTPMTEADYAKFKMGWLQTSVHHDKKHVDITIWERVPCSALRKERGPYGISMTIKTRERRYGNVEVEEETFCCHSYFEIYDHLARHTGAVIAEKLMTEFRVSVDGM